MKWIDLTTYNVNTKQFENQARVILTDSGTVEIEGNPVTVAKLETFGVDTLNGTNLTKKDGEAFFNELTRVYNNPMSLQATEIQEGPEPKPFVSP